MVEIAKKKGKKPKEKKEELVSYYDTKGKQEEYLTKKNLKKIRIQTLREFCEFALNIESFFGLLDIVEKEGKMTIIEAINFIHSYKGAKYILSNIRLKNRAPNLSPKIIPKINFISKRTVYDYMNAYKFIKAVNKRSNRIAIDTINPR